jgi:hypothetical protein
VPDIWIASEEDLPECLVMGEKFTTAAGFPFDPQSSTDTLLNLMNSQDGILLMGNGGMVGGLVYPAYFDKSYRMAQELFWWAETPGLGVRLLTALEQWARSVSAHSLTMLAMADMRSNAVARLYRRSGFKPLENTFVKVL